MQLREYFFSQLQQVLKIYAFENKEIIPDQVFFFHIHVRIQTHVYIYIHEVDRRLLKFHLSMSEILYGSSEKWDNTWNRLHPSNHSGIHSVASEKMKERRSVLISSSILSSRSVAFVTLFWFLTLFTWENKRCFYAREIFRNQEKLKVKSRAVIEEFFKCYIPIYIPNLWI